MVAIKGGAWTASFLLGLMLVLAAQAVMAEDEEDREILDRDDPDSVVTVEQVESIQGSDPAVVASTDPQGTGFAAGLLETQDGADEVPGSTISASTMGQDPTDPDLMDQDAMIERSDQMVDQVSQVVEQTPERVEQVASTTKARLSDGSSDKDPGDDGAKEQSGSQSQSVAPSLEEAVCGSLAAVCDAPAPSQFVPQIPSGPSLPGLPMPSTPDEPVDQLVGEDGSSHQPQQVAAQADDEARGMGTALAAAAATVVVLAVAATAAGAATGSTGALGAWAARVLAGVKGFFLTLYARLKRDKVLDHETRKELFLFLQANPGACITRIQNVLGTSLSTTRHHLDTLRSHGLVVDVKSGRRRCFFTQEDGLSAQARTATAVLTSKATRRVYRQIERRPGIPQQQLAAALRVSRTSVIFQVRRLKDAGMVRQDQEGRQVVYHPVGPTATGTDPVEIPTSTFDASMSEATPDFSS